jgi:3-hydroxyisobutyrate dehydrogenase
MAPRLALGARAGGSPAEAARGASVVGIVVFDDAQVADVLTGADGALAVLEPGAVVAVHTTATLGSVRALAAEAATGGVVVLDAGVSGGETGAASGTLVTMVGGPAEAVDAARPVLEAFSKEVVHAGPLGAGMALKLARNATGYAMMAAVFEAMALCAAAGVDVDLLRHVILETAVLDQSLAPFDLGGPTPLPDGPSDERRFLEHLARLADKDLDGFLALAGDLGVDPAVTRAARAAFPAVARLAP